jgi:hypothetical protein
VLAVGAAVALGAGDAVWWLTRHRVAGQCSAVMAHSRWAPYLAVASVVLAFASLLSVVIAWSSHRAGARRGRWTSIILSSLVMVGAALSLLAMSVDATFEICF